MIKKARTVENMTTNKARKLQMLEAEKAQKVMYLNEY
jgi:hypothetical protein